MVLQGSAEAVRDAVQALSSESIGVRVVGMGVGPVSAYDVREAGAVGADIIAFGVKTAGADVDTAIKNARVNVMSHRVIYSLLDEVRLLPSWFQPAYYALHLQMLRRRCSSGMPAREHLLWALSCFAPIVIRK